MIEPPSGNERPAEKIARHLQRVTQLRRVASTDGIEDAVREIKRLQAQRFRSTYGDFLARPSSAPAVRFFLDELYGEHDFSRRDAQFGRIASAVERLFPPAVSSLAVDLTEAHMLTETLDHSMGELWDREPSTTSSVDRYIRCWRVCARREDRNRQLAVVLHMGRELQRLTRMKPLRLALRMMRQPARAAGLDALQHFLESGFDAFASMTDPFEFLQAIQQRESQWITSLFDEDLAICSSRLEAELKRVW